mgnify:CR=1 FL=1
MFFPKLFFMLSPFQSLFHFRKRHFLKLSLAERADLDDSDAVMRGLLIGTKLFIYRFFVIRCIRRQPEPLQDTDGARFQLIILDEIKHAHGHTFAMQEFLHMVIAFDRVPDRMAEIEDLAQAALLFVLLDDCFFHAERAVDDLFQMGVDILLLKQGEQLRIIDQSGLQCFSQAVDVMAAGQRGKHIEIDQHLARLPESADVVFHPAC